MAAYRTRLSRRVPPDEGAAPRVRVGRPLSAVEARLVRFPVVRRRGLDPEAVREFQLAAAATIQMLERERQIAVDENTRLKQALAEWQS